ncbi:MAG TPA: hypothetical protein VH917_06895, partial [Ignavibacteriaceae bacterium]
MPKKFYPLYFILILLLLSCSSKNDYKISDIIQPINLEEGLQKEILISDLFYAPDYNIEFILNKNFSVSYDT